jgi:hypothetical protein
VHRGSTEFAEPGKAAITFRQMNVQDSVYRALQPIFGKVAAVYEISPAQALHASGDDEKRGQLVTLVEPASAAVKVVIARGNHQEEFDGHAWVPQHGVTYQLPIQKAPWFGANEVELAIHDSGRATKIKYAGGGDAAGLLGVRSDAHAATQDESAADEAKRVQGEADLIYQQQRLVLCQTNPANCPK